MARRRYSYYGYYFEPTKPLEVEGGIKARSKRGDFAKNWWATRWIEAMERLMEVKRLRRGRNYARRGQVLSIEETKGGVTARVQGSRRTPYKVSIQVKPLSDAQWEKVIGALANQALFTAQLLAGEMPQDIEEAFAAAGVSLFPDKGGDLVTDCSCPDWANPCKHVAATHYILGEQFDEDPFLLFRLRGRSQEQVLEAMRQRRADQAIFEDELEEEEPEQIIPLKEKPVCSLDDDFPVGRDAAHQGRNTVAHGFKQGNGQALNFRGQHEQPGVAQQLSLLLPCDVTGEDDIRSAAGEPSELINVGIRPTRSPGKNQFDIRSFTFSINILIRLDEPINPLLWDQPAHEQKVILPP